MKEDAGSIRTIHALALAVDAKDRYTRNHSERVALYATAIAVRIGLPTEYIEQIAIAGTLHDVGKIAIPDRVLLKPTTLTEAESSVVQRHCEEGERMVRALGMAEIATWIRHHHERWDGEGYPDGLAGERIPLPSRIVGVADAMDAMTTARAYHEALSQEQATQELLEHAERQFDPEPVGCLVELLSEGTLTIPPSDSSFKRWRRSLAGGVVDREPSTLHVDPRPSERDPLGFEQPPLTRSLGQ